MATLSSIFLPRRVERGGVSWVTLVLVIAAAGCAWMVIAWAPIYIVHFEVKQTVRNYMNQAVKDRDDAKLVANLCAKLLLLDTSTVTGEDGTVQRVPSVVVAPADVTWERDADSKPPMLHVAFEYTRTVRYPLLTSVTQEWVGQIDLDNDLTRPDWGPER